MKIIFTKHAKEKFRILKELGWNFKQKDVKEAIKDPDFSIKDSQSNIKIVFRGINSRISLRVVHAEMGGIIVVITFHPVERSRYEKKQG